MSQQCPKRKQANRSHPLLPTSRSPSFWYNSLICSIRRLFCLGVMVLIFLTACSPPQAVAKDRTFLDLSLEFLSEYELPKLTFDRLPVGGLSAIAYDRQGADQSTNPEYRFYALSDDPSEFGDARFYTLKLALSSPAPGTFTIKKVTLEGVTYLTDANGKPFGWAGINPEGLALSPRNSLFIASEGVTHRGIPPTVAEFDLETGKMRRSLPIPQRYLPETENAQEQQRGVLDNLGFESLTLDPESFSPGGIDPFRLFTAIESPLAQDRDPEHITNLRLLHYLIVDKASQLVSEHFYSLDPAPLTILNGLTELVALGQGGHFLSLERSFGLSGYSGRVYQVAIGSATDTSRIVSLKGNVTTVEPLKKKLLFDLSTLGIPLYNLEGMTLGPKLPDGSQTLLLVSDDNFDDAQKTQFLLFRLKFN